MFPWINIGYSFNSGIVLYNFLIKKCIFDIEAIWVLVSLKFQVNFNETGLSAFKLLILVFLKDWYGFVF